MDEGVQRAWEKLMSSNEAQDWFEAEDFTKKFISKYGVVRMLDILAGMCDELRNEFPEDGWAEAADEIDHASAAIVHRSEREPSGY